jgi:hypothetical protein
MGSLEIARRRMANSRLTGSPFDAPEALVRWHGAMQAQDYGPAKWSIAQRARGLIDEGVDRAVASGSIVRTHVLRPTWHFVARDDIRWMLALTAPRVHRHNGPRYRELGLEGKTLARCESVIVSALEGGNRLTRAEIESVLKNRRIDTSGQRIAYMLLHCELEGAIGSGGLSGKQQTYARLDERVPAGRPFDRDESLVELTRRYLTSHGPATVQDFRWWSSLTVADIRKALHLLGPEVRELMADGLTFWSMASDDMRAPGSRGAHFLQAYDELIVGYTESRYVGDPRAEAARAAFRDRTMPNGIILLNGAIAGHWRRTLEKDAVTVQLLLSDIPSPTAKRAMNAEAKRLARFLGRTATVETSQL